MILEVFLHRKHRVAERYRTRGRGGPGGWVWTSTCRCGWRAWTSPNPDSIDEQIEAHLCEEQTMVDVLDDRGFFSVSYLHIYSNTHRRAGAGHGSYLIQMGRWDV